MRGRKVNNIICLYVKTKEYLLFCAVNSEHVLLLMADSSRVITVTFVKADDEEKLRNRPPSK